MKLYNITKQFLAVVILSISTFVASATPVTMNFTGTLNSSFDILHSGDAFSGSYTYDPSVAGGIFDITYPSIIGFVNVLAASVTVFSSPGITSFSATSSPGVDLGGIVQMNDFSGVDSYQMGAGNFIGGAQIGGFDIAGLNVSLGIQP